MKGLLFSDKQLSFMLLVNLVIVTTASIGSQGQFVSVDNLQSMGGQLPELGLLAIGVMLAMISGNAGIDLSGVALANLCGVVAAMLAPQLISPDAAPFLYAAAFCVIALSVGIAGGVGNGVLIAKVGLTPLLATLGTQLLFTGIAVVLSGGSTVRIGHVQPLAAIGNETLLGVPIGFLVFIAVVLALAGLLRYSVYGVRLYLMGTNPTAARYAGIPLSRMLLATYATSGALASVAGVIIASRTASVKWDYGSSYLLITILIVVMAGVKPAGGHGRMASLLLSATALQLLSSAFNLLGFSNFFRDCAWGLLLLLFMAASGLDFRSFLRR